MKDVIVIGAGPAGARTALGLAKRGHSVQILDASDNIGDKLCTGIISAECARRYKVPDEFVQHEGRSMRLFLGQEPAVKIARHGTHALVIDRVAYIRSISDDAVAHGADLKTGRRVQDIKTLSDSVVVTSRYGDSLEVHRAKAVVVASGFRTQIASAAGLHVPETSGYAAQVQVRGLALEEAQIYARKHMPASFFGWLVPQGKDRALLGLLGRTKPLEPFYRFVEVLKNEGLNFEMVDRPRVWGVPLKASRRTYSDRCLLVGDAAGQIKPTSGGGIYYSLQAADMASAVLSGALQDDDLSARSLGAYERSWKSRFGREITLGYLARLFYEKMGDDDLVRLLKASESGGLLDGTLDFDRHSRIFTKMLTSNAMVAMIKTGVRVGGAGALSALAR